MDRMQIALKLGMDLLDIPICMDNYRKICNAVYLAEQKGVHIDPTRMVRFSKKYGCAISPKSHEYSGCPSRNLVDDVEEIEYESKDELKWASKWNLDKQSKEKLLELKVELESGLNPNC